MTGKMISTQQTAADDAVYQIMAQADVYASARSQLGRPVDVGQMFDVACSAKAELEGMVRAAIASATTQQDQA